MYVTLSQSEWAQPAEMGFELHVNGQIGEVSARHAP